MRRAWGYLWKAGAGFLLLILLVAAGLLFYASTAHFSNVVRMKVIAVLQDATGGRIELRAFHWNLRQLTVEVDDLTIHGLEGPGELPYAHIDRLYARARILSLLDARLGLDYLEVDRPSVHLIVYPDGSTNQPRPKAAGGSGNSATQTIFDLKAARVEVRDGMALLNERAIPFELAANNLGVVITYAPASNHYLGEFACSDIIAQQGKNSVVRSKLDLRVEAAQDAVDLKALDFTTGKTTLRASGTLAHFAHPQWKGTAAGTVDLAEVTALGAVDGFKRGSVELNLTGQGSESSQFVLDGTAKIVNAAYAIEYFWVDGLNATTRLHITPDEISMADLVGRPRQGGIVNAAVRYQNWMAPAPPPSPTPRRPQPSGTGPVMSIRARVHDVRLSTVLQSVMERQYRELGFDTTGEGTVNIDWTGSPDDLTVAAVLAMSSPRANAPGELPLSGNVDAKYFQRGGRVQINQLIAHSPATNLNVTGSLGVYPLNEPSNLAVHLTNRNLGEFDDVLKVLDLGVNGKKGISGLPVQLHGEATFDGSATGSLVDPAFQGHLTATQFSTPIVIPAVGPTASPLPSSARSRCRRLSPGSKQTHRIPRAK